MAQIPGPEDHDGLFERGHREKRIDRILEAATRARVKEAEKARPLRAVSPLVRASKGDLGRVLAQALGASPKGKKKASVRAKTADGARSFHFEAYYTSRDDAAREAYKQKHRAGSSKLAEWGEANKITPHGTAAKGADGAGPGGGGSGRIDHDGGGGGDGRPGAPRTKASGGRGSSAAHLAYIEREGAVERLDLEREVARELGLEDVLDAKAPARGRGRPTKEQQAEQAAHAAARTAALEEIAAALKERRERALDDPDLEVAGTVMGKAAGLAREVGRVREDGRERDPFERDTAGRGQAAAAQAYMENPQKLRNGELSLSSFGNIGATYEERRRFWDLLEEHERKANARVQNRIIMELPHQATPEARAKIMRDFAATFDEMGLPYHVAIHAPGPQNDDRNFHAHIVWSERPAKRMIDPATGGSEWDFAITKTTTTKCRHTLTSHPYRQDRNRDVTRADFIPKIRKRYAQCVNEVMKTVDPNVKFDPRSYKDMGVTTDPIETVSRITNDRLLAGGFVIQDAAWTKRMVEAELAKAVIARNKDVEALIATTKRLETLKTAWPSVNRINAEVGPFSKMLGIGRFTRKTYLHLVNQRLAIENMRLQERVVTRAEAGVVKDVLEATSKARREARRPDKAPAFSAEEREAMAAIHEAAALEMAAIKERSTQERRRLNGFVLQNKLAWKATGDMMLPPASSLPTPKRIETPDPKTGKVPFLAGAAADAMAPRRDATRSASAPKTKARTTPVAAATPRTATPSEGKTKAPRPTPAADPLKPRVAAGPAASAGAAGRAAPRTVPDPNDPATVAAAQARAKEVRDNLERQAAKEKAERAANKKWAAEFAAGLAAKTAAMTKSMFGDLKGQDLANAVKAFNEDLAKSKANSKNLAAIVHFIGTGSFPAGTKDAAPEGPAKGAATETAAAPAQDARPAGQAQGTAAPEDGADAASAGSGSTSATPNTGPTKRTTGTAAPQPSAPAGPVPSPPPATATQTSPDLPAPTPGSIPAPTPRAETRPRLEDVPVRIPNIFDHLEVVETGKTGAPKAKAEPPPAKSREPQPPQAAVQAAPEPDAVRAERPVTAPPAPNLAAREVPEHEVPNAPGPTAKASTFILTEGALDASVPIPAPAASEAPAGVNDATRPEGEIELAAQEDLPEEATGNEAETEEALAAAKRRKAARRAGFVKRGKGGRGR